jgi:hypothetical protein
MRLPKPDEPQKWRLAHRFFQGVTVPLLMVMCSGCMTGAVIQEARRAPRPMKSLATTNKLDGEVSAPLDHPKANYLLLPATIPADIVTSPIQLFILLTWPNN